MPRKSTNTRTETNPHFDGKRDQVIKDAQGVQIGIITDKKVIANPSEASALRHEAMKRDKNENKQQ